MDSAPRPGAFAPGIFFGMQREIDITKETDMIYSAGTIIIDDNPDLEEPHVLVVRAYANCPERDLRHGQETKDSDILFGRPY
jgi:hypothetical protein